MAWALTFSARRFDDAVYQQRSDLGFRRPVELLGTGIPARHWTCSVIRLDAVTFSCKTGFLARLLAAWPFQAVTRALIKHRRTRRSFVQFLCGDGPNVRSYVYTTQPLPAGTTLQFIAVDLGS